MEQYKPVKDMGFGYISFVIHYNERAMFGDAVVRTLRGKMYYGAHRRCFNLLGLLVH